MSPQKFMGGDLDLIGENKRIRQGKSTSKVVKRTATQEQLPKFAPLFAIGHSATHKKQNNLVYCLDALDAYNQKLVKKIEVKGIEIQNQMGINSYLYCAEIVLCKDHPPRARLEFEQKHKAGIAKHMRLCSVGDNFFDLSKGLQQYKDNYKITDIAPFSNGITFLNGKKLFVQQAQGDVQETDIRRIQIRETIISHFEKEKYLFKKGIKVLSFFFVDKVDKYRDYNQQDPKGEYARIFEQEYLSILSDFIQLDDPEYREYLHNIKVHNTHKGYFSVDKNGKMIDSQTKMRDKDKVSDDTRAYDLILKNKEQLLSFTEPTRFIFSHSALREGWDNPNIFQICALKHSDNTIARRQEVGRGLRICVDQSGNRCDYDFIGSEFDNINKVTVIATDSYSEFVAGLQKELQESLYDRASTISENYFLDRVVKNDKGEQLRLNDYYTRAILRYMLKNDYLDDYGKITTKYNHSVQTNQLIDLPSDLQPFSNQIHKLIQGIVDISSIIKPANQTIRNTLNQNFYKQEFRDLWNSINKKYVYRVDYDDNELITKAVQKIDNELFVSKSLYLVTTGEQNKIIEQQKIQQGQSFEISKKQRKELSINSGILSIQYDIVDKIARPTNLTRKVVVQILKNIHRDKFLLFKQNPEEFISKVADIIIQQKATMVVSKISYNPIDGKYQDDIFTVGTVRAEVANIVQAKKHITDYVVVDGLSNNSVEHRFAQELDNAYEVVVYAKLPSGSKGFQIPTPVGNYSPDWAIAFDKDKVKHIYFIAETKGSMNSLEIRPIEQAKIDCAKKLFNELSTSKVRYHNTIDYKTLLDIIKSIK